MGIGTIIGSTIAFLIMGFWALVIYRARDRKEPLTIMEDGDTVRLFLTDSDYDEFSIADIKENKERVYEEIKKLVQYRSKELVRFVDRVTFFKDGDPKKEQELLIDDSDKKTQYESITVASPTIFDINDLNKKIEELLVCEDKISKLKEIIPEFDHRLN